MFQHVLQRDTHNAAQLLYEKIQRLRGGHAFKARRLLCHPTLGLKVIKKKRRCGSSQERIAKIEEGGEYEPHNTIRHGPSTLLVKTL